MSSLMIDNPNMVTTLNNVEDIILNKKMKALFVESKAKEGEEYFIIRGKVDLWEHDYIIDSPALPFLFPLIGYFV